nr:ABC transporter substrate-binding protein [Bacteroidota bacterium]
DLAMAEFLPLADANPGNPHSAQAAYFYALAALNAGKLQEAGQMLQKLRAQYDQWVNMPEARYLLANVLFESKAYEKALSALNEIPKGALGNDVETLKYFYLNQITGKRQFEELVNEFQDDIIVAKIYANKLIGGWYKPEDKRTLEKIVSRHNLDRERYLYAAAKKKDGYNVATLLPFQLNQDLSQNARKNQFVSDLYAGMQMAQDTLRQQGIKINLFAYDAGNDTTAVKRIMNSPDLKQMDLVIGPVYRSPAKVAARLSSKMNIPVINPLSQDLELAEGYQNVFLFESSVATQARQAATYAYNTFIPKTTAILYENTQDDTTFAYYYRQQFLKLGGKVRNYKKINSSQAQATASNFRSLNLTDLGHLAVFSNKMTAAVNATSLLQGKAAKLPLVTYDDWLDINQITLRQLDNLEVYFVSPKFIEKDTEVYKKFRENYIANYNLPPSIYAYAGYELLYFYGKLLHQYGTNLNQALADTGIKPGILYNGVGYTDAAARQDVKPDNQYVPLTKLENLKLVVVNPVY